MSASSSFPRAIAAVITIAFLSVGMSSTPAMGSSRPGCGRIAFIESGANTSSVGTISPDGSARKRLITFRKFRVERVEWSRDGRRIAFIRRPREDGGSGLSVMRADGSRRKRVTGTKYWHHSISWAPGGGRIALVRSRGDKDEIVIVRLRDGRRRVLVEGEFPAWSPDGSTIAFSSPIGGKRNLATIPAGGGSITPLTSNEDGDHEPRWSPDGQWIAFSRHPDDRYGHDGPLSDIWKIAADGSGDTPITDDTGYFGPRWSPDGKELAYSVGFDSGGGVYVGDADGSGHTHVSGNGWVDQYPDWAPTGRRIVYWSAGQLVVLNLDSGRKRVITRSGWRDYPRWSPC